mgnify:CR=1 FL=1
MPIEFNIYSMKLVKYFEFNQQDLEPIKSFYLKDELNTKLWDDFKLEDEVREQLLQIAQDFYEKVELSSDVVDIVLTGSLCNYNWSEKYSDYDLHVIIDFDDIEDNSPKMPDGYKVKDILQLTIIRDSWKINEIKRTTIKM